MKSKSLLIAIAAFAVTATGANAYMGESVFARAGLSVEQRDALEEAKSLRASGDVEKARDVLVEAGIDEDVLTNLRTAMHATRAAMQAALEANDYAAFKEAIADSPLADIITDETDFALFQEAHELKKAGEHDEARAILTDLGVPESGRKHHHFGEHPSLSDEQRDALRAARQANDHETVRAILDEVGDREEWGRFGH